MDTFTDAVFEAEGMGDMTYTQIHGQVREVVERHMTHWQTGEGGQGTTEVAG